jgi:VanZ family protein
MPTERFVCLASGVGIMMALLFVGAHRVAPGWDKVAHFVCFALITALLWRGTAGKAPLIVPVAVIAFGALDELHEMFMPLPAAELLDFVTDAAAALAVAVALFTRRKLLCAESSER